MRAHTWRVAALLFGSGACALVYQIAWLREFRLIFGASTAASAAVLAIFLGGLGAGGLLLGRRADRASRPMLFYSQLEALVAISAAASPLLLALVRELYIVLGGTPALGLAAGTIGRLVLTTAVLALPTIAMGGTLPAAARGVTRQSDARRQDVAALYALNTLGAVTGSVVATFFLLEIFGTRMTLWLAAAANLLVAVLARQVDRSSPALDEPAPGSAENETAAAPTRPAFDSRAAFVLIASGVVGFAFFLMELVWYRMLGPLLGGSVFTFGLILGVALAGIGIGGLLYALVGVSRPATLGGFALSCLLEAAAVAMGYALGDRLAVLALVLQPLGQLAFGAHVAGWAVVTCIVVLAPAIVAGYQFPMLIALLGQGRARVGREIGLAYAANTLGAILGSLAGGFGLLPWLSAPGAWRLVTFSLLALGASAALLAVAELARRAGRRTAPAARGLAWQLGLAVAALVLLAAPGPTAVWRHSGIGAGRAPGAALAAPNQLREWSGLTRRRTVWDGDGIESSVALVTIPSGYAFTVNGKTDGSARTDAATQVMSGLVPALLHSEPRRALVIGLGTGTTAGWLGVIPAMERVDVVELEPLVLEVARACRDVNHDVMNNPKVHITIADARETLLTTRERYDVIVSEPSNPFRAGIASLFTREYYEAASGRLTDGGLFAQWVQAYEVDTRTLRTMFATLASVFPHVETWHMTGGDLLVVAAKQPISYRADELTARLRQEPFRSAALFTWRAVGLEGVLGQYVAGNTFTRALASADGVDINTDDRNVIEFGFARTVGRGASLIPSVRALARAMGDARPPIDEAAGINWAAVDTAWVSFQATEGVTSVDLEGPPQERARQTAIVRFFMDDVAAARRAWQQQSRPPAGPTELAVAAGIEVESASDAALPLIEQLRAFQPGEADTFLAELRLRQGRDEEAAAALEAALARFRRDPWPLTQFKQKAVAMAGALGQRNPLVARRMYAALREPFSVRAADEDRLGTMAGLTRVIDFRGLCRDAVGAFEPHVPWTSQFLGLRRDCYEAVGDPRLEAATRDIIDFISREGLPLETGIEVPAPRVQTSSR